MTYLNLIVKLSDPDRTSTIVLDGTDGIAESLDYGVTPELETEGSPVVSYRFGVPTANSSIVKVDGKFKNLNQFEVLRAHAETWNTDSLTGNMPAIELQYETATCYVHTLIVGLVNNAGTRLTGEGFSGGDFTFALLKMDDETTTTSSLT